MQRDAALTFRDIHGSLEQFEKSLQEIESLALIKQESPEIQTTCKLRFLQIMQTVKGVSGQPEIRLHLTTSEEFEGTEKYIAVSYTWDRFEPTSDADHLPKCMVYEAHRGVVLDSALDPELMYLPTHIRSRYSTSQLRSPKCPDLVLRRTVQFALVNGINHLWIDQECINQDDKVDVEAHLQCMHTIYARSLCTLAVLSCSLNGSLVANLSSFLHPASTELDIDSTRKDYQRVLRLISFIRSDRWFTRTWCFQEKFCGQDVHLLLKTQSDCTSENVGNFKAPSYEVALGLDHLIKAATRCYVALQLDPRSTQLAWKGFAEPSWSTYREFPMHFGSFKELVDEVERCDNTVVSDRLAVLVNIWNLRYTLKTTTLNTSDKSYSTCLLLLLLRNGWLRRRYIHVAECGREQLRLEILDMDIWQILKRAWNNPRRACLEYDVEGNELQYLFRHHRE